MGVYGDWFGTQRSNVSDAFSNNVFLDGGGGSLGKGCVPALSLSSCPAPLPPASLCPHAGRQGFLLSLKVSLFARILPLGKKIHKKANCYWLTNIESILDLSPLSAVRTDFFLKEQKTQILPWDEGFAQGHIPTLVPECGPLSGMALLGQRACVFWILMDMAKVLSSKRVPIFTPTSSIQRSSLLMLW